MKYRVTIREVYDSRLDVEADSLEQAVQKALDGDYENEYIEYSHTPNMPIEVYEFETGKRTKTDISQRG